LLDPYKPDGLKISTIAIKMYIDIDAIEDPIEVADAVSKK
tara:strand:- start:3 stop:122 length:120 start_codon:yes stop_codon:yes gene_type:complete